MSTTICRKHSRTNLEPGRPQGPASFRRPPAFARCDRWIALASAISLLVAGAVAAAPSAENGKGVPRPSAPAVIRPTAPTPAGSSAAPGAIAPSSKNAVQPSSTSAITPVSRAAAPPVTVLPGSFRVLASTSTGVSFEFAGDLLSASRLPDGTLAVQDRIHPDAPKGAFASLPVAHTWIALPAGEPGTVQSSILATVPLAWPAGTTAADRKRWLAVLAPRGWTSGSADWMDNQWGVPVSFCPVIPDGNGGLLYVTQAELTVQFGGPAGARQPMQVASGRDPNEAVYRSMFLNYEAGKAWRRAQAAGTRKVHPLVTSDSFSSSTNWIKLFVPRRGIYQVTGTDLKGLAPGFASADLSTLRLFTAPNLGLSPDSSYDKAPTWMREVPITVLGSSPDSVKIRFLGLGPDGWYDDFGLAPTSYERYYKDQYNNNNVYWLTWGGTFQGGAPLRIPTEVDSVVASPFVNKVVDRAHFEQNTIWDPRPREVVPPAPAWERFWWVDLQVDNADAGQTVQLSPSDPDTSQSVRVLARFWGNSYQLSRPWPDHDLKVLLNGHQVDSTATLKNGDPWDFFVHRDIDQTGKWLNAANPQLLRMIVPIHPTYHDSLTAIRYDHIYLAWVEMDYTRNLIAHGDSLSFFAGGFSGTENLEITGFTNSDILILDGTGGAPQWIVPHLTNNGSGWGAQFRAALNPDLPASYVIRTGATLIKPQMALFTAPNDGYLRGRTESTQMIIVTHANFAAQAAQLQQFRRTHMPGFPGNANVQVVDVQEVMDEYAFGRLDPVALRNFLQFAHANWTGGGGPDQGPSYVLLLGATNYDFRNQLGQGAQIYIPTYEGYYDQGLQETIYSPQFGSDDFYGFLDTAHETATTVNLILGRMPARTSTEAADMVNKTVSFENPGNVGPWRGRVTLVADDICQGREPDVLGFDHMIQTEKLPPLLPTTLQIDKVYLYEYGTECIYDSKPAAAAALLARMNDGTLLVNFTGHGSETQLADERVFELASVPSLTNQDRLFIFFTASCSVGKFDVFTEGLGESMILYPGGGAISVFSASAISYSNGNAALNEAFVAAAFPGKDAGAALPVGQAANLAKATLSPQDVNSKRYVLLGDPAVRIGSPQLHVALTLKDDRTKAVLGDTLKCGELTDLTGQVTDDQGQPVPGYSGTVDVRLYDSSIVRGPYGGANDLIYDLQGAPIYAGQAQVTAGSFSIPFMVPLALRRGGPTVRGPAQIFAYVQNGTSDGGGSIDSVYVPEAVFAGPPDHTGPTINFQFSGDPNALQAGASFTATLFDSSGINITSLVNSRSVIEEIDQNGELVYAEDVASHVSFGDDFRTASLNYALPVNLSAGVNYDLILRASDNLNNSSQIDIPFVVGSIGPLSLNQVFNFPNPTRGSTRFFGALSQDATVDIQVFTLTGKRIWRLHQPVRISAAEFSQNGIEWDGRDLDGDGLANGVYLYKVTATPTSGTRTQSVVGKLVVAR